jgi:hypothetical protein
MDMWKPFRKSVKKNCLRRKSDLVLIYDNRYLLAAIESGREGAQGIMARAKELFKLEVIYRIAVYPEDGADAERLLEKVKTERT